MRFNKLNLSVLLSSGLLHAGLNEAFNTPPALSSRHYNSAHLVAQLDAQLDARTDTTIDCGCEAPVDTVYAGNPSNDARNTIKHREVIANLPLFKLDGTSTTIDDILGTSPNSNDDISLVVFLRSFG